MHVATPVFDGASEDQIFELLETAQLGPTGQTRLRDGRTGEAFDIGVNFVITQTVTGLG